MDPSRLTHSGLDGQSFRGLPAYGVRTVSAVWLGPVLLFVLLAPQQTGACAELVVLRESGRQLPPWLIVLAIVGHLSLLWWGVVFFGFPWVVGGAAGRFADRLVPSERRLGYVEQANRFYGRSLVVFVLLCVALAGLFGLLYALPIDPNDERFTPQDVQDMLFAAKQPAMVGCSVLWWLAAAAVVTACGLVVAAMAVEDVGLPRAIRRALAFAHGHQADAARLWSFVTLLGLPDVVMQQTFVLVPIGAIPLLASGVCVAAYNVWAMMVVVAVGECLYFARGSATEAG